MLRVLALSDVDPTVSIGGLERHQVEIYRRFAAREDVEVRMLVIGESGLARPGAMPSVDLRFAKGLQLGKLTGAQATVSYDIFRETWREISEFRPDVIHAHTLFFTSTVAGVAVGRARRVPVVTTMHLGPVSALPWKHRAPAVAWEQTLGRGILRGSLRVIAVSGDVRGHAARLGRRRGVTVIPNGVDTAEFTPATAPRPAGPPVLVTVGRLFPNKGNHFLLDALALLMASGMKCSLVIAGDGPAGDALKTQAAALGLADCVTFLGATDDVPSVLRAADIFVRPSLTEGMSLAVLEGMAAGLPVVASDITGVRESLTDGVEGLIVPPGNVEALAGALARLIASASLRGEMGASGRARALQFGWDAIAERTLEVLRESARPRR